MKKLISFFIVLVIMVGLIPIAGFATSDVKVENEEYYQRFRGQGLTIDVYNWGENISNGSDGSLDVNEAFEKLTGIKVRYTTFASNEDLYAKLKGSGTSYDVIIPSDYMIARMIDEKMIQPLNFDNIPNYKYIGESYRNLECDKNNLYSVPYTWGCVGILYNKTMTDEVIDSWDYLWNSDYIGSILMFSNPRDAFGISLKRLGLSMNSTVKEDLDKATAELKKQKMLVQAYVMDEIFDKMGGGEATIAPYYNGDAAIMIRDNPNLAFAYPKEGTNLFVDSMVIPSNAKNKEAAEMYINFMCEPEVAYATSEFIGYSSPNLGAIALTDEEILNDPVRYPPSEVVKNSEVFNYLPEEINEYMDREWVDVLSYNQGSNKWVGPVFLGMTFAASVAILVIRSIKHKKSEF